MAEGPGAPPDDLRLLRVSRFASRAFLCVLLTLAAVGVLGRALAMQPATLTSQVALTAASCGRSVADGSGLRTGVVYPVMRGLGLSADDSPLLATGPFYPAFLAGYFQIRGETDLAVRLGSAIGLLVCVWFSIAIGARLAGFGAGLLAGLAVLLNQQIASTAVSGGPSIWVIAWFTAGVALLLWDQGPVRGDGVAEQPGRPWAAYLRLALAGIAVGLAYLTEPVALALVIPALVLVRARRAPGARGAMVVFIAGFLVCAVPWWIRNMALVGNPLFSLDRYALFLNSSEYPEDVVLRDARLPGSPYGFGLSNLGSLAARVGGNLSALGVALPAMLGLASVVLCLVAFLARPATDGERALRAGLVAALVALWLWTAAMPSALAVPLIAAPIATILSVVMLVRMLAGQPRARSVGVLVCLGLVVASPVATSVLGTAGGRPSPTVVASVELAKRIPQETLVVTDEPATVSWYAERTAVLLPRGQEGVDGLLQAVGDRPVAFFLTEGISRADRPDMKPYRDMLTAKEPPEGLTEVRLASPGARVFTVGQFALPVPEAPAGSAPADATKAGEGARP